MFSQNKIFISHSSQDGEVVRAFVELLYGLGLNDSDILCTSSPTNRIPITEDIYDYLKNYISEEKIFAVFFLSDNYYSSPICLNEMGAVWLKQSESLNILLPDFDFNDIKGVVTKSTVGIKLGLCDSDTKSYFNEFKSILSKMFNINISETRWETIRDTFLSSVIKITSKLKQNDEAGLYIEKHPFNIPSETKFRVQRDITDNHSLIIQNNLFNAHEILRQAKKNIFLVGITNINILQSPELLSDILRKNKNLVIHILIESDIALLETMCKFYYGCNVSEKEININKNSIYHDIFNVIKRLEEYYNNGRIKIKQSPVIMTSEYITIDTMLQNNINIKKISDSGKIYIYFYQYKKYISACPCTILDGKNDKDTYSCIVDSTIKLWNDSKSFSLEMLDKFKL